jgi:RNA polymerase sigma-70 factor (ECF subfamily)
MNDDLTALILGARDGNPDALEQLATRFQKMIKVHCSLRLDDSMQVEDAAQEVTEQMLSDIRQLRAPEAFTAWLQQIIVRTCSRYNKRHRNRRSREVDFDFEGSAKLLTGLTEHDVNCLPEASFDEGQAREQLLSVLGQLPISQSTPLVMHYFRSMSYKQIADTLGIKIGTVSSNISKAKRNLNRLLIDEG